VRGTQNILGWLGREEGRSVMQKAELHIQETCKTVAFLAEAVAAFLAGNLNAKTVAIGQVKESERTADKLLWGMVEELSAGLLMPPDREDLLRFATALDKIADTTNKAARLLAFIENRPTEEILRNTAVSVQIIVKAADALRSAIHAAVRNDARQAMTFCLEVERFEHEADDQKRVFIAAVLRAKLEAADLLLTYNLAEALESITDRIDTAADLIKRLNVRG
jgi:predicted phosphate transport protein (TIGR00153 family)